MAINIIEGLEIVDVYLKNQYQEIFICKDKETDEKYLLNVLLDEEIELTQDLIKLPNYIDGVKAVEKNDGKINILTKYYESPNIIDFLRDKKVSLSRQTSYGTSVLDKLLKVRFLSHWILQGLLDHRSLIVGDEGNVSLSGILFIDSNYRDIGGSQVFKKIGETLHVIYSGDSLESTTISDDLPPDIEKVIINCINGSYNSYEEVVREFKNSKLYGLINPESKEGLKVRSMRNKMRNKRLFYNFKKTTVKTAIIILILSPLLVFSAGKLIGFIGEKIENIKDEEVLNNNIVDEESKNKDDDIIDITKEDNKEDDEDILEEDPPTTEENFEGDDLDTYYNEELLSLSEDDKIGKKDDSISHKGPLSIRIDKGDEDNEKSLVGIIDLRKDGYSFLRDRKVNVSLWLKGSSSMDAIMTLELYKDNNVLNRLNKKVKILKNSWSLYGLDLNTTSGEYIKVYVNPKEAGSIWVDSISIDILK